MVDLRTKSEVIDKYDPKNISAKLINTWGVRAKTSSLQQAYNMALETPLQVQSFKEVLSPA